MPYAVYGFWEMILTAATLKTSSSSCKNDCDHVTSDKFKYSEINADTALNFTLTTLEMNYLSLAWLNSQTWTWKAKAGIPTKNPYPSPLPPPRVSWKTNRLLEMRVKIYSRGLWQLKLTCPPPLFFYFQILNCKELPEYPRNMTCSKYNVYKRKAPGLITQAMMMMKNTWSFTVTKLALAWEKSSDGIGNMAGLMWRGLKGLLGLVGKIWNGLLGLVDQVCEIWSGLTGLVDWIVTWITRLAKGMYSGSFWLAESIWNNIVYLPHLIWNGTLGMAEWAKEKIIWLAEISQKIALWSAGKTWSGSRWLAEWTWMEAKWSAEWTWKVIERSCKPIEPVLEYLWETIEVVTEFYNEYVHGE